MQATVDSEITYETIERNIELASRAFNAYKKTLQWMDLYLEALFEDREVAIEPSDRLGFSPYGRLRSEEARIGRAAVTLKMIEEGKLANPQRSMIAAYNSLQKSNIALADGVAAIVNLYYDLADEFNLKD